MFPFGVTFYPDQWPKEIWEKEFLKISEAGFNVVRFGEMAWNWIEPKEGKFDFSGMDLALDLANKYGLKVVLGIGTAQAPPWLVKKYPHARPVAHDGTIYPEYGPRPNVCRDSSAFRKLAARYIGKIVRRYAKHPALLMWQMDNEPVYPPLDVAELKDYCHCESTRKAFINWAAAMYGSIEEANRVWGTKFWTAEFSDFSEVTPPKGGMWEAVSPHIYLDWMKFKTESLHGWLIWMRDEVKRIDPAHKVGTNGFIGISPRVPDHSVLSEGLDWYGWDVYPKGGRLETDELAMMADLWRSYVSGRETEFHVTELQGGPNVRWGYQDNVNGPEIRRWTHQVLAHGAKAILYHAWRPPLFGSETGGFGILSTSGGRTERLVSIEKAGRELKEIAASLETHRIAPRVAIAFLRGSDVETYQEQGPTRAVVGQWAAVQEEVGLMHSLLSIRGAYRVVWNYFNPAAFIFERHIEESDLPFEAILLPNPYVMKEKHMKHLKNYVYNGGTLITEARFGLKNEFGHLYERPLIETLVDITYDHSEQITSPLTVGELGLSVAGFRDLVSAEQGVVLKFSDGSPALIEKRIGKGRVLYAAFSIFHSLSKDGNTKAIELLRSYLPQPSIRIEGAPSVEAVLHEEPTPLVYVINHGDGDASVTINVPGKFGKAEDLLSRSSIEFPGGRVPLSLKGSEVRVLKLS